MQRPCLLSALGALTVMFPGRAEAADCASPKPEWVFCDDFESTRDQSGQLGLWDDQGLGPQNLVITTDPTIVHGGARALQITAHKGQDTGGEPTKWFLPSYDQIYVRFWTRFAADYNYLHHMVFIGASEASNKWAAFGTAGCRPSGTNFFVTQVEPFSESGAHAPPGAWGFYTYSNDMKCDPGATCANYADAQQICNDCATKGSPCTSGLECCWGANDLASPAVSATLGKWTCVEARVEANVGGASNGTQTLFVDGRQVGQWSGIRFRSDDALKINSLGLWHYVTDDVYAAGQSQETLWFDDVVVSTAPIGCASEPTPDAGTSEGGAGDAGGAGGASMDAGGARGGHRRRRCFVRRRRRRCRRWGRWGERDTVQRDDWGSLRLSRRGISYERRRPRDDRVVPIVRRATAQKRHAKPPIRHRVENFFQRIKR
jgi:hypothetical protein